MAFPTGYTKYQNVTVDNTKVDATLTDYPCLVDLSDLVKSGADLFDTCRSDGGDIRVTLTNGTTQLAREIVSIDTTAKTGEMHVKIPSLASGTDTVIRVWYNGTDTEPAVDSTYGSENTWNSNYKMVQHMNQDPSGSAPQMIDSTSNDNDGTSEGSMVSGDLVAGQIGNGLDFDGSDDAIGVFPVPVSSMPLTLSAWVKPSAAGGVISIMRNTATWNGWYLEYTGTQFGATSTENTTFTNSAITSSINNMHHAVGVFASDTSRTVYADGTAGTEDTTSSTPATVPNVSRIGAIVRVTPDNHITAIIDEVRVLNTDLSADWISTEYNNQSSPGTFYSVSDEQGGGGGLTKDLSDTITISDSISLSILKTVSDNLNMSDNLSKALGISKADIINLTDIISKESGINLSDTITMSDNFNAIITLILSLNDTINMSDDLSKSIGLNKSDTINLTDNISYISEFIRSLTDTVNISDAITKEFGTSFADTINMTDNFDALVALILALNDSITMSDSLVSKDAGLNKSDTISMSDEIIKSFGLTKSDIINISDHFSSSADIIAALLDFVAKNRNFNFNAKNKTFNFNAKSRGDN